MKRYLSFGIVGGIGFATDAGVLALLLAATALGPLIARLLSIGVALTVTWLLNRSFTFQPSGRGLAHEGARYGGIGITTSVLNYLVYTAILLMLPFMPPLGAVVISSATAALASYLGYSRLVFDR